MKFIAIVQARMGSIRFPGKVMKSIIDMPMIEILLKRLSKSKLIDQIVLATSIDEKNKPLIKKVEELGFVCFQGKESDVLDRYVKAAEEYHADVIVRITGDCPLVDPVLVDDCIQRFKEKKIDYLSNTNPPSFPDGLDIEIIHYSALKKVSLLAKKLYDREHVTPFLKDSAIFSKSNYSFNKDLSAHRWTVDDPEDYDVISKVFDHFKPNIHFGWEDVLKLYNNQPQLFATNSKSYRNEGAKMKTGQKLWKRAKRIIPGGNMLLSKRPDMFLPNEWPTYFSKSKGCKVWDMDGKKYIDMSMMGVGTNILGYGNPEVDEAVIKTIQSGNMSTLNCPEEVYLAEKLIELHKWSDMVKFARSGGEANAIAIRIARASSGKDKVAICGYHGWHDWYLSANLSNNKKLDGHLLPGLEPKGVPRDLKGTVFPFKYNDFNELCDLIKREDIGIIKMEVERNETPKNNFLQKVRDLATKKGIILIFDECTSGFRETFGGLHKKYNIEPDIAIFGKALGNGYSITAIIGRREIMESAQSTFISSTFWTERIGPTAAIKTLEVMEREKTWELITNMGSKIRKLWQKLADNYKLNIIHSGLPSLASFMIDSKNSIAYKTLITQKMLAKGFLAGNSIYVCTKHTEEIIDQYFEVLDEIFKLIKECEDGRDIKTILKGDICNTGFKRLN